MAENIKINTKVLQTYLAEYKTSFNEHRFEEIYKWQAVKCFQDNWDVEAPDFLDVLMEALAKTYNLLASNLFLSKPKRVMPAFADQGERFHAWPTLSFMSRRRRTLNP